MGSLQRLSQARAIPLSGGCPPEPALGGGPRFAPASPASPMTAARANGPDQVEPRAQRPRNKAPNRGVLRQRLSALGKLAMIKMSIAAVAFTIGLSGYALAQETTTGAPAGTAPMKPAPMQTMMKHHLPRHHPTQRMHHGRTTAPKMTAPAEVPK